MVQEVTTNSWFKRIISSFVGVLIGIALVIGGAVLVFWNEGNGLGRAQALQQTEAVVITVPTASIDPNNNLRVVHFSGLATTEDELKDKIFDVSVQAIKLNRQVEMYQWKEETDSTTEKQLGGSEQTTKTYTYKQVWSGELIDSKGFKELPGHINPSMFPIRSITKYAAHVNVGAFTLPRDMVEKIDNETNVDLSKMDLTPLQTRFKKNVELFGDSIFIGKDANAPQVGDMRVTIKNVLPTTISVLAQQTAETLQPYQATRKQSVSLVVVGEASAQQMIATATFENTVMTWIWRFVALICLWVGFGLIMAPLRVLADIVPFFGSLVGLGTGLIAFVVGLMLWTVLVALAWFVVRPVWAVGLVALGLIICYGIVKYKKRKASRKI